MKKCLSCGYDNEDRAKFCEKCHHLFPLIAQSEQKKVEAQKPIANSDLFDYPLLTFIFGLLSLLIPLYIFSFLTLKMSKKVSSESMIYLQNFGKVLAYLGFLVSTIVIGFIIFTILA